MSDDQERPMLAYASRREVPEGEGREGYDKGNLVLRMSIWLAAAVVAAMLLTAAMLLLLFATE